MTITAPDDRITEYNPVSAITTFAADFPVYDNSDLSVFLDGVEQTGFTVTATYVEGISTDAKVVFESGLIGQVLVVGTRDPRRGNRFTNGAPLPIWQQNLAFDTLEAEMQEAGRDITRAVKVPIGSTGYTIADGIPDGSLLVVEDGQIKKGPEFGGIADAVSDAQQAAADASLAEQAAAASATDAGGSAIAAAGSAAAAAASQGQAQNLVDAAQAAYVGFQPNTFYDLGRLADDLTLFPGDLGRLVDL